MNPFVPPHRLATLQIEITRNCNLACAACPRTDGIAAGTWRNADMAPDAFQQLLDHAPPADLLLLAGIGEPALHPQATALVAAAVATRRFGAVAMGSNGLAGGPELYAALQKSGLAGLRITLSSLNEPTAAALRKGTDVAALGASIAALAKLFGKNFSVVVRVSRRNAGELENLVETLAALGVARISIQPDDRPAIDDRLEKSELASILKLLGTLQTRLGAACTLDWAPGLAPNQTKCRQPLTTASLDVAGNLAPCLATSDANHYADTCLRDLRFADAWGAPGVAAWLSAYLDREPTLCRNCAFNPSGSFAAPLEPAVAQKTAVASIMAQKFDAAQATLTALVGGPVQADNLHLLGMVESHKGNAERAVAFVAAAAALDGQAHIRNNLGTVLAKAGRLGEAETVLRQLVADTPSYPTAYISLSGVLADKGEKPAAIAILVDLAELALKAGKQNVAGQAVDRILALGELHPRLALLGHLLRMAGAQALALRLFEWLARTDPNNLGHLLARAMTLLPVAYETTPQMQAIRARYREALVDLRARVDRASDSELAIGGYHVGLAKPFYLAYQGENDVELQRLYGEIVARMSAKRHPQWTVPVAPLPYGGTRKLRVGFACGYFSRHSVSKLFAGWIRHMSRAKFQVIGYDLAESEPDEYGRGLLADFDAVRRKVDGIDKWAATIRHDALDALIYPEIGMESQSVRLAALRLAPLQMVAMGHPMTTGIPNVDVFLTSDLMEPADGETHYTERLLRLPNLSFDYERQPSGGPEFKREELGLDPTAVVFICCQSLFKYRPDDDGVIVRIAREVPNAQFAFLGVPTAPLTEIFSARLGAKFAAAGMPFTGRVVIVPPVAFERFGAFLRAGDIYLDSLGWSGGNTSLEAASVGLPIVTTPGGPMRARHTAAILHFMGLGRYVAASQDAYVAFAAKLATDAPLRKAYTDEIARNAGKLFGDLAPVRTIENFIVEEIAARELQQAPSS